MSLLIARIKELRPPNSEKGDGEYKNILPEHDRNERHSFNSLFKGELNYKYYSQFQGSKAVS